MGNDSQVILTEKRRDVLNQEYSGAGSSERTHHSLIRQRSQTALDELVEVAESPVIHNPDVFDTKTLAKLVKTLLTVPEHLDEDNPDDEAAIADYLDYRDRLKGSLAWELSQANLVPDEAPDGRE
jgi:hypothetical protein